VLHHVERTLSPMPVDGELRAELLAMLAEHREAVALARSAPGTRLEASGGLSLARAREVADTGVTYLSVGALTHSAPSLDLGLDIRG